MMTYEEIAAFVREQIESEWRLNANTRRSREQVITAITDRWDADQSDAYNEAADASRQEPR